MLGVELVAELVRDGKIALTEPVERVVTYHDPCRLNKRKGVHEAPRELLRAIPGLTFKDVDRVTQWSYCSRRRRRAADREAGDHRRDQPPARAAGGRHWRSTR